MFAIIGASGNVGRSTSSTLRQAGVPVRAIVHDAAKAASLIEIGCEIAAVDLQDSNALAQAIRGLDVVQVVLLLRPQISDPAADLRLSGESIINALKQARSKRVLVISDYGAHISEDIGMPSVFHGFEAEFHKLDGHNVILRSAEHMHNWGRGIPEALESGISASFQDPVGMLQPTIAAQDLGKFAAKLLLQHISGNDVEIVHAEGPRRYSAIDVASAISELSGRTVEAKAVPRSEWTKAFEKMPSSLADLLVKANDAKNKGGLVEVEPNKGEVLYGTTELIDALRPFVPRQ